MSSVSFVSVCNLCFLQFFQLKVRGCQLTICLVSNPNTSSCFPELFRQQETPCVLVPASKTRLCPKTPRAKVLLLLSRSAISICSANYGSGYEGACIKTDGTMTLRLSLQAASSKLNKKFFGKNGNKQISSLGLTRSLCSSEAVSKKCFFLDLSCLI